jgi:hypothetical protein
MNTPDSSPSIREKRPLILGKQRALAEICRRLSVHRLELFGSAASGEFVSGTSDLDFLVEFAPLPPDEYAEAYFSLRAELEHLYGTAVDLVTVPALANPFFRTSIDESRRLLYAA